MPVEIKVGELADFFESAHETARDVDRGEAPEPKNRVWLESDSLTAEANAGDG